MPSRTSVSFGGGVRGGGGAGGGIVSGGPSVTRLASYALVIMSFAVSMTNVMIGLRGESSSSVSSYDVATDADDDSPLLLPRLDRDPMGGDMEADDRDNRDDGNDIDDGEDDDIDENYDDNVVDGELVTRILRGETRFPIPERGLGSGGKERGLKFAPGTLNLSRAESLRYCFVNSTHYRGHLSDRPQSLVSLSDVHKLIYRNNPKSSSSSARHAMQDFFEGRDHRMKHDELEEKVHEMGYSMISFVRDPLSRFYSSYDEAYFRMGPWMGGGHIVDDKPRVKKAYLENRHRVDKYPYLYTGFGTIDDFRRKYCPENLLSRGRFLECNNVPSIDDGDLATRFEKFVRDYSGLDPFDIHLNLQVSNLVFTTGEPFPFTAIYNSTDAERGWQEIAKQRGVVIPNGEMTHGRKITRRFNVSMVSDATKRKICRIMALDYCCLNIALPRECSDGVNHDDGEVVYCSVERRDDETMKYALEPMVIHPWKDP